MSKVIGVFVSVLVGLLLAAGVSYAVVSAANPDNQIDLRSAVTPDGWAGVPYGAP